VAVKLFPAGPLLIVLPGAVLFEFEPQATAIIDKTTRLKTKIYLDIIFPHFWLKLEINALRKAVFKHTSAHSIIRLFTRKSGEQTHFGCSWLN
jgi:hypothetical protein